MLELNQIDLRYPGDQFHLHVPKLSIVAGEKIAIIGPSGSGKTTLMNAVAGITVPQQGKILFNGTAINTLSDTQRRRFRLTRIGFVFQDFGLIEYLSVKDNILHPYRINNTLKLNDAVKNRMQELAHALGVATMLHKFPNTLSQGEKQRVAICRALVTQPELILADEATGNLDPDNKLKILDLLFRVVTQHKATLIAVTHDHALLSRFDRVIDMDELKATDKQHA